LIGILVFTLTMLSGSMGSQTLKSLGLVQLKGMNFKQNEGVFHKNFSCELKKP